MKKIYGRYTALILAGIIFVWGILEKSPVMAGNGDGETSLDLYAKAAVLIDGDSGRLLYGKNEDQVLPMASTTKIMTLIVALENGDMDDLVNVSAYAASMPDVQLGIREGERYRLKDLCYSLMLESHNDTAVAIAEHIGGSVEKFAEMMNDKARALGCDDTYFITPNGLDASDENKCHSTTAFDLATILSYAIKNKDFLEITRTPSHSFGDLSGHRSFTVNNKNALLTMTDEAISGKTGFTGSAGYCYAGAVKSEGRTFVIALLGCGWPPNKTWKWKDAMTLINYGKENYQLRDVGFTNRAFEPVQVIGGQSERAWVECKAQTVKLLLGRHETFEIGIHLVTQVQAPVTAGALAGSVEYKINDRVLYRFPVVFKDNVGICDYQYYLNRVIELWLVKQSVIKS